MKYRVRSYRTSKEGYATKIKLKDGSHWWQVVDEGAENIVFFTDQEFSKRFSIKGAVDKVPAPEWVLPEKKEKPASPQQLNLFLQEGK